MVLEGEKHYRITEESRLSLQIDFPEVVKRKHALIMMKDVLSQMIQEHVDAKEKSEHIGRFLVLLLLSESEFVMAIDR